MSRVEHLAEGVTLYLGDCREVLPTLGKFDAVVTDPPYCGVKPDAWDNQWKTGDEFIVFIGALADEILSHMVTNGSLYHFASPQMAARIEVELSARFHILNNIVWNKGETRNGACGTGIDITALRLYWSASSERIIFAEHYGSDRNAGDVSGYFDACLGIKSLIFGDYLRTEFSRAKVTSKQIATLFPSKTGRLTGCVSNWLLGHNIPTPEQYQEIRKFLNHAGGEYLRREYEDLRREYEDLRRPFFLTPNDEWGDVWSFGIERRAEHPTQKPVNLMRHIIKISSRSEDSILDPFMGSGTTGVAAVKLGRKFTGIEIEPRYFDIACRRISEALKQPDFFIEKPKPAKQEAMEL